MASEVRLRIEDSCYAVLSSCQRRLKRAMIHVRMITRLYSAALRGVEAHEVEVEVEGEGVEVYPIRCLKDAWDFLIEEIVIPPFLLDRQAFFNSHRGYEDDFDEVRGQHHVKRALEVAAAGNHNLLRVCCDYQVFSVAA